MSGRKRRRHDPNDPNAPSFPDIPGVPMDAVPLFVHAIKMCTKYFNQQTTSCRAPYSEGNDAADNDEATIEAIATSVATAETSSSSTVINNLMDRIEATADSARTNEEYILQQQQQRERQTKMESAIEAWLEIVKRYARNENRARELQQEQNEEVSREAAQGGGSNNGNHDNNNGAPTKNKERPSVALSCFLYAWGLQLEHGKVAPRRAALHLCGLLLEKSRDCRFHLAQEDNLSTWIKTLSTAPDQTSCWTNLEQAQQQIPYWQREAEMLLSFLVEQKEYDALYPKLGVALIRFRQLLPNAISTTSGSGTGDMNDTYIGQSNGNMFEWRQSRDIALRDGEKEIKRVKKLIKRVYGCTDILVPRMGTENDSSSKAQRMSGEMSNMSSEGDAHDTINDDDDEEDIDWEDGDGDDGEDMFFNGNADPNENGSADQKQPPLGESHEDAVERTLATMEASGGLRGGEIEIKFGQREETNSDNYEAHVRQRHLHVLPPASATTAVTDSTKLEAHSNTLRALGKFFKLLHDRHMPRLSTWVEGLTNADNLKMLSSNGSSAALVSLDGNTIRKRHEILEQLVELKKTLASVLSSAMRLLQGDATNTPAVTTSSSSEVGAGDRTAHQGGQNDGLPLPALRQQIALGSAANLTGAQRNNSLLTSFQRQQRRRNRSNTNKPRSGRIQIKYRSS